MTPYSPLGWLWGPDGTGLGGCPLSGVAAHVCGAGGRAEQGKAGQGWGCGARAKQARAGPWGWIQTCCLQMLPF